MAVREGSGKRLRAMALAIALTAAGVSVATAPAQASAPSRTGEGPTTLGRYMDLWQQSRLRMDIGLPASAGRIRALTESPMSQERLGLAVDAHEAAILDRKAALTAATERFDAAARAEVVGYDGLYLETDAARGVVLRTTGPEEPLRALARKHLPDPGFRIVRAAVTVGDLGRLKDRIVADRAGWRSRGVDIRAVGTGIAQDAVTVEIASQGGREVARRYGPHVRVTAAPVAAEVAATDFPPRKAGHGITSLFAACTAAFEVIYYPGNLDGSPNVATLTAGHCGYQGEQWREIDTLTPIGSFRADSYDGVQTNTSDAGLIGDLTPLLASNRLIDTSSYERRVTQVSPFGSGFDAVGATVCKFGDTTKGSCGYVQDTNYSFIAANGKYLDNQRKATAYSCFGDSGGPIFGRGGSGTATAVGVISHIFYPSDTPEGDGGPNDPRCLNQLYITYSHVKDAIRDVGYEDGRVYYVRTKNTG